MEKSKQFDIKSKRRASEFPAKIFGLFQRQESSNDTIASKDPKRGSISINQQSINQKLKSINQN